MVLYMSRAAILAIVLVRLASAADPGDFNNDGRLDAADIDALSAAIREADPPAIFDVNEDGRVSREDHFYWVWDLKKTFIGDANLDLVFNSSDLVQVFQIGEYEDAIEDNSGWADGDWTADFDFNTDDLVASFQAPGYEEPVCTPGFACYATAANVPEPSGWTTSAIGTIIGAMILGGSRRRG